MSSQTLAYFVVDAFTPNIFGGNPAAVCVLDEPKSDSWLQFIAAEFNLSETAFLWHIEADQWKLRWFTPLCEVNLCGHATLAAAHVLARELGISQKPLLFSTLSGVLRAEVSETKITLNFPRI